MKNINESGRSMVEMLGVLAIIGVLSIGGIAGYTMAMNKYYANEIVNSLVQAAIYCRTHGTDNDNIASKVDIETTGDDALLTSVTCTSSSTGQITFAFKDSNVNAQTKTNVCKTLGIATDGACPGTLSYTPSS